MKLRFIIFFIISLCFSFNAFTQNYGRLSGQVIDAKTEEPLIGASVILDGTTLGGITDVNGKYVIEAVLAKTYNITASYVGYSSFTKYNIVVRSEGNYDINFSLTASSNELENIVITANPFEKLEETPLSIQKLSQDEIASYPGGNNDIAKVVQSLPGVSGSVGGFRNDVIIRGGAPNENVYFLDGIEIPNINHFATQGSAGGPVGMLNVSFFEGVTLESTAFGAQYDNVLSGVLQFDQRNGNDRKLGGNIRLGASESGITLEGPLFKKDSVGNTTFIVSARRSYLQFLFGVIGLPFLPDYWDYQYKLNHKIDEYNDITITGVGSIDDFSVNELEEYDEEQQAIQDQVPVIQQWTSSGGISWKRRFKNASGFMQTTLSMNVLNNNFMQYQDNVNQTGLFFSNNSRERETKLRYKLTKFFDDWTINTGFSLQDAKYENITEDLVNGYNYNTSISFNKYGFFGQLSRKFTKSGIGISFGLRFDGNTFTDEGNEFYRTFSPRFAISYELDDVGRWLVNASAGRYFKLPPYTVLGFKDNNSSFSNSGSHYIRTDHLVLGIEHLLTQNSRFTIEGFLKRYGDYPVSLEKGVSLANLGGGFEVLGNEPVASIGLGRTYGLEFLYQQKFNGKYYAIAAYTLFRSEYTGFDSNEFIPSSWDSRHLVSLTTGYKMNRNWEISARYRYLGKTPFAPVNEAATLANYPAIILDYTMLGAIQLDAFSQLDLRIDKKWNFKGVSLDVYLDIQNVLGQSTPQEPRYGLAREADGAVIVPETLVIIPSTDSGSIIPSIGLLLNF